MELEYKIKTTADLAGAEAAANALERQIGKAKALKQDYAALEEQLKTMRGSIDEAKESMKVQAEVQDSVINVTKKQADAILNAKKATKKLEISKRELLESIRGVTREYPILGEVARAVFNPLVLSVFGIIEAFNIWREKVKGMQELLGGWELPDLSEHASSVDVAAESYGKMTNAVKDADEEFSSAAGIFERQKNAIEAQVKATTELIQVQKEKALADLNLKYAGKDHGAAYDAEKSAIEQGASDQTAQLEIAARNSELDRKEQEVIALRAEAAKKSKSAAAIQPSLSDEGMDELISKSKAAEAAAKKAADDARAKKKIADDLLGQEGLDSFTPQSLGQQLKYDTTFGALSNPHKNSKLAQAAADAADQTAAIAAIQTKQLEEQKARRSKLQNDAAKDAGGAEAKALALQGENDPNQVGSTAYLNNLTASNQRTRNQSGLENRAAADINHARADADIQNDFSYKKTWTPADTDKAKRAQTDAAAALADAAATIKILAGNGENVSKLAAELKAVRTIAEQAKLAADHH